MVNHSNIDQQLNHAIDLHRNGNVAKAGPIYAELIQKGANHPAPYNNLAAILIDQGDIEAGINILQDAPMLETSALLSATLGSAFRMSGQNEKAILYLKKAVALDPSLHESWNSLGSTLRAHGHWNEAVEALKRAITIKPHFTLALYNLANAYLESRDLNEAISYYKQSIESDPGYVNNFVNLGNAYRELRMFLEAENCYKQALELDPNLLETTFNLGVVLFERQQFPAAIECFSKTITDEVLGVQTLPHLIGATQKIAEWKYSNILKTLAEEAIRNEQYRDCPPFNLISILDDPELILKANQQYTSSHIQPKIQPSQMLKNDYSEERIQIAYLSNDFHDHATSYLIAGLFELHDKSTFEITILSFGPDDPNSLMRNRIKQSGCHFIDISMWNNEKVIEWIRNNQVRVLIDLKGYTAGCRPQILANKPAPVQIQYLGYPSTMGAEFIDYFIGDDVSTPPSLDSFFSEKIIRVPNCYQVNDYKRIIGSAPSRESEGLPSDGFVFASFNSIYKITPEIWTIWMSILKSCPTSVLWLLEDNEWGKLNLLDNARSLGIEANRIIWGKRKKYYNHLTRLQLADLALDTFPCNGHTTTSDALFAGVPVLTLIGKSFHSRVSASLLSAAGLQQLITPTIGSYALTAVNIAANKAVHSELLERLKIAKNQSPLFSTKEWTTNFESELKKL